MVVEPVVPWTMETRFCSGRVFGSHSISFSTHPEYASSLGRAILFRPTIDLAREIIAGPAEIAEARSFRDRTMGSFASVSILLAEDLAAHLRAPG